MSRFVQSWTLQGMELRWEKQHLLHDWGEAGDMAMGEMKESENCLPEL